MSSELSFCILAFSLHICLFTRGAILLGIESAPLSEDEDEDETFTNLKKTENNIEMLAAVNYSHFF